MEWDRQLIRTGWEQNNLSGTPPLTCLHLIHTGGITGPISLQALRSLYIPSWEKHYNQSFTTQCQVTLLQASLIIFM